MGEILTVSSATTFDYIALNANIKYLYKGDCQKQADYIRNRFAKYGDAEERVESFKKSRGCGQILNKTVDIIDNIRFKTCICTIKHPLVNSLLRLSELFNKGILPFNGCLMEQPSQIIELLEVTNRALERVNNG